MKGRDIYRLAIALALLSAANVANVAAQELRSSGGEQESSNAAPADGKARLTGVRLLSSPTYTRIIIDLTKTARFEVNRLPEDVSRNLPPRIYVDVFGTLVSMDSIAPIPVQDGLVRQVRVGQNTENVARIVLDMNSLREHKAFILPDPYRLVIEIQGTTNRINPANAAQEKNRGTQVTETVAPPEVAKIPAPPVEKTRPATAALPAEKNRPSTAPSGGVGARPTTPGIHKIVLDPGHGGKDPGAIGVDGLAEKDLVLRVAKKLATKLQKEMGVQVVLTRKDDLFVALENRTAIANAEDADVFISLHMNAAPTADAKGLETYYLDNTTDEASIRLAARENATSRNKISDLQFILSDMMQNSKLEDSISLAHNLHGSLVGAISQKTGEVRDLGVKKALFSVLVGARMPSVLVEMFFITNKTEGRAMAQDSYQDAVVDALYDGIVKYHQSTFAARTL